MNTRITELLDIEYPIIQGGLAYLADANLAAAVSNAGGLGQITAVTLPSPEDLRKEIQKLRTHTTKPFGVNFAISMYGDKWKDYLEVAIEEEVPVVTITGGNPTPLLERIKGLPMKKISLVSTVKQAKKAESLGMDAIMAVGQEGGGHIGRDDLGTMVLIPQVVDAVKIPVIASGGIGDGRGLMAALALGAEGIEMGTRFIATKECQLAHENYKKTLVEKNEMDTVVIKRSLGIPARAIANPTTEKILQLEQSGADYETLKPYISGENNKKAIYDGKMDEGYAWAGQVMGLIHDVPTVKELILRIVSEAEEVCEKWKQIF
ncbi:NAD(P)H-dependent flavin oxidoreductase [Tepidibacillus fermentans]|uniref:Probable nitronate monooxygenase n=1 Tax=Tepidibacillus fermentans TaxID=1281767 RepID=A0A4R3KKN3_9BACI|nr:nitronate monooxygenase family protein [Tepidibacillus fermentans]TCS84451.1 2-nitropropane dioxygenase precursor [Tepidibacillus fermentans]